MIGHVLEQMHIQNAETNILWLMSIRMSTNSHDSVNIVRNCKQYYFDNTIDSLFGVQTF